MLLYHMFDRVSVQKLQPSVNKRLQGNHKRENEYKLDFVLIHSFFLLRSMHQDLAKVCASIVKGWIGIKIAIMSDTQMRAI